MCSEYETPRMCYNRDANWKTLQQNYELTTKSYQSSNFPPRTEENSLTWQSNHYSHPPSVPSPPRPQPQLPTDLSKLSSPFSRLTKEWSLLLAWLTHISVTHPHSRVYLWCSEENKGLLHGNEAQKLQRGHRLEMWNICFGGCHQLYIPQPLDAVSQLTNTHEKCI